MSGKNQAGDIGNDQRHLNPMQEHVERMDAENGVNTDTAPGQSEAEASRESFERMQRMAGVHEHIETPQTEVTQAGWFNVDMSQLGKQGKLYPSDMQLIYRAARAGEIRHWSNLDDDSNIVDASQHITDMIAVCVRCVSKSGDNVYSYKDIYEHDKWKLLMMIHDITFPENAELTNPLKLNITSGTCKHKFDINLSAEHINIIDSNPKMDKYINSELGLFEVTTKSFGVIRIKPSTIGVGAAFTEYIRPLDRDTLMNAKSTITSVQALALEWRGLNNKKILELCQSFNAMDALKELPLKLDILDACKIAPADTIKFVCPTCHMEGEAPFRFPNGVKQIFRPISNLDEELL